MRLLVILAIVITCFPALAIKSFKSVYLGVNKANYDVSSILDMESTTQGMLAPRMDTTARDNIATPATSLFIFNTSTAQFEFYNGATWAGIGGGGTEFADDVFRIQAVGDLTKEIAFSAAAITTATTRTVTMPDTDVDLTDIATNTSALTGKANIALDNLASVLFNSNLIPDGNETRNIGSNPSNRINQIQAKEFNTQDGVGAGANVQNAVTGATGNSGAGLFTALSDLVIYTAGNGSLPTGDLRIETGSAAGGTDNSGSMFFSVGNSTGGTAGNFNWARSSANIMELNDATTFNLGGTGTQLLMSAGNPAQITVENETGAAQDLFITGASSTGGDGNGGDIEIRSGQKNGAGIEGDVRFITNGNMVFTSAFNFVFPGFWDWEMTGTIRPLTDVVELGSSSRKLNSVHSNAFTVYDNGSSNDGGQLEINSTGNATFDIFNPNATGTAFAKSIEIYGVDATDTTNAGNIYIRAPNNTNITSGDGGSVLINGGASTAGTAGNINLTSSEMIFLDSPEIEIFEAQDAAFTATHTSNFWGADVYGFIVEDESTAMQLQQVFQMGFPDSATAARPFFELLIHTGDNTNAAASGDTPSVEIFTGELTGASSTGDSGTIALGTGRANGASATGNSGPVNISTGTVRDGASGNISLTIGGENGAGSRGQIGLGGRTVVTSAGFIPSKVTADPCSGVEYPEGSIFYNDTSNYMCYCDGTNDVQMHSPITACF